MKVFLQLLLFWGLFTTSSYSQQLSNSAEISLITCSPGAELYSLFGHSALRVQDDAKGFDWVFNYGTFNFNTPNFYLKFTQGKLNYLLSVNDYSQFIENYKRDKRSVYAQKLQMTPAQKQQLFENLVCNYRPENRAYKYDFFMDNCATRIDSIIKVSLPGSWETATEPKKIRETYRTGIAPYLKDSEWLKLGLNIILGAPTDNPQEGLFLPDIMQQNYANTTYNGKLIVGEIETLYDAQYSFSKTPFIISPLFIFSILAFLLLIGSVFFPDKLRYIDFFLFAVVGIAGCIISFVSFTADYAATKDNWNILWALPTHLPIAFFLLKKRKAKWLHYYFLLTFLLTLICLIFVYYPILFGLFGSVPVAFPFYLLIPILLSVIFRSLGIVLKKM